MLNAGQGHNLDHSETFIYDVGGNEYVFYRPKNSFAFLNILLVGPGGPGGGGCGRASGAAGGGGGGGGAGAQRQILLPSVYCPEVIMFKPGAPPDGGTGGSSAAGNGGAQGFTQLWFPVNDSVQTGHRGYLMSVDGGNIGGGGQPASGGFAGVAGASVTSREWQHFCLATLSTAAASGGTGSATASGSAPTSSTFWRSGGGGGGGIDTANNQSPGGIPVSGLSGVYVHPAPAGVIQGVRGDGLWPKNGLFLHGRGGGGGGSQASPNTGLAGGDGHYPGCGGGGGGAGTTIGGNGGAGGPGLVIVTVIR